MLRALLMGSLVLAACGSQGEGGRPATAAAATSRPMADVSISAIDVARMAQLRPGDAVRLDLGPPAGVIEARTVRTERLDGGRVGWTGAVRVPGGPDGEASLVINGRAVTGSVRAALGKTYRIRPTANGNVVEATDHGAMRPD